MKSSAVIDQTLRYRWTLRREWDESLPRVAFIMLNPSTADATNNDPTLRRCLGFAERWGYGSLEVVNLFAYRATNPQDLKTASDPVGSLNDDYLMTAVSSARQTIVAWGNHGTLYNRAEIVLEMLSSQFFLYCLGVTKTGQPKHPLYVPNSVKPILYYGDKSC